MVFGPSLYSSTSQPFGFPAWSYVTTLFAGLDGNSIEHLRILDAGASANVRWLPATCRGGKRRSLPPDDVHRGARKQASDWFEDDIRFRLENAGDRRQRLSHEVRELVIAWKERKRNDVRVAGGVSDVHHAVGCGDALGDVGDARESPEILMTAAVFKPSRAGFVTPTMRSTSSRIRRSIRLRTVPSDTPTDSAISRLVARPLSSRMLRMC